MARNNTFTATDGKTIHYLSWIPRAETSAVVQIVHGMAEHAARYEHAAKYFNKQGYSVYADNHRGHGITAEGEGELGFFSESEGWFRAVEDVFELTSIIKEKEPDKPVLLLGHSMGSLMARTLMILHPDTYQAVVLSGTSAGAGLAGVVGRIIAAQAVKKNGPKTPNPKLDQMTFGSYGKAFEPNRTKFDWLSRDPDQVDAYIEDPLCGFIATSQFFLDLITGLQFISSRRNMAGMKKDIPVLIASGSMDPVGNFGKGVRKVHEQFVQAGMEDVSLEIFEHARHEILNETNRDEAEQVIESWMRKKAGVFEA